MADVQPNEYAYLCTQFQLGRAITQRHKKTLTLLSSQFNFLILHQWSPHIFATKYIRWHTQLHILRHNLLDNGTLPAQHHKQKYMNRVGLEPTPLS